MEFQNHKWWVGKKQKCKKVTGVCKYNYFSGPQLWKLDGNTLLNKEGLWISDEKWIFRTVPLFRVRYPEKLICIININKAKVWETKNDRKVILEKFEEYKPEQLWKKGMPSAAGYSTLENSKVPKIMTAISSSILRIIGNIPLR